MYAAGANLNVGSGTSQLTFSLLVVGLSLAPGLAVLVPVVLRDARGSALAGKSRRSFLTSVKIPYFLTFVHYPDLQIYLK